MTGGMIFASLCSAPHHGATHHNATLRLSRRISAGMAGKPSNAAARRRAPLRNATQRIATLRCALLRIAALRFAPQRSAPLRNANPERT